MSHADDVFFRQFGGILGLLVIFAVVVWLIAGAVGGASHAKILASPTATLERIAPVGSVAVAEEAATAKAAPAAPAAAPAAAAPAAAAPAAADDASQKLYTAACSACHAAGVANAPKLDDNAAWTARAAQGLDGLLNSVVNGKGAMPPRAGRADLKDAELRAIIQYMLKQAGVSAG